MVATAPFKPGVYIRPLCAEAHSTVACGNDLNEGGTATAVAKALPAGRYFVWVDGATTTAATATQGLFNLTVTVADPESLAEAVEAMASAPDQGVAEVAEDLILELHGASASELRDRARQLGIAGASSMRKAELVDALRPHEPVDAHDPSDPHDSSQPHEPSDGVETVDHGG